MKPLKMYTPERIALLLLAAGLIAWALVNAIRRDTSAMPVVIEVHDTVTMVNADTAARTKKPGTRSKGDKQVTNRNHLDEPVATE